MSEQTEELTRHDGVSLKKKRRSSVKQSPLTTPKPPKSEKGFSAILETLPLSKRRLFEKRGVIRVSPKTPPIEPKLKENSTMVKKKRKRGDKVETSKNLPPVVTPGDKNTNGSKKKIKLKKKLGGLGQDTGSTRDINPFDISGLDGEFIDETMDSSVNRKIIDTTSQYLLSKHSKSEKSDLSEEKGKGKGKDKHSSVKTETPKKTSKKIKSKSPTSAKIESKLVQPLSKQPTPTDSKSLPIENQASPVVVYEVKRDKAVHKKEKLFENINEHVKTDLIVKDVIERSIPQYSTSKNTKRQQQPVNETPSKKPNKRDISEVYVSKDIEVKPPDVVVNEEPKKKKRKKKKRKNALDVDSGSTIAIVEKAKGKTPSNIVAVPEAKNTTIPPITTSVQDSTDEHSTSAATTIIKTKKATIAPAVTPSKDKKIPVAPIMTSTPKVKKAAIAPAVTSSKVQRVTTASTVTPVQEVEDEPAISTMTSTSKGKKATITPTVTSTPKGKNTTVTPTAASVQEVEDELTISTVATVPESKKATVASTVTPTPKIKKADIAPAMASALKGKKVTVTPTATLAQGVEDELNIPTVATVPSDKKATIAPAVTPTSKIKKAVDEPTVASTPKGKKAAIQVKKVTVTPTVTVAQEVEDELNIPTVATAPKGKKATIALAVTSTPKGNKVTVTPTITSTQQVEDELTISTVATVLEGKNAAIAPTVTSTPKGKKVTVTPTVSSIHEVKNALVISSTATLPKGKKETITPNMTSVQEAEADHTTSTLATVPEIKETTIAPTVTSVQEVEADHTTATMATIPEVKEIAVTPNVPSVQEVEDRHTTSTVTTVPEAEEVTITPRMASAQEVEDDHIISTVATVSEVKEASDVTSVQEVADRHATSTVTIVPEAEEVTITPRMTPTQEVDAEADRTTSTLSTVPEAKEVTIAPTVTSTQEVEDDYTNATLVTIPETNEIAITPTVLSIQEVEAEHTISASIGENHVGQNLILAEDHVVVEKVPTDRLSSPNATINDAKVTVTSKDRGAILEAELPVENLESTIDLHDYDSPIIEANKDTSVDTPQKLYDISQMDKNISCNEDRFTPSPILFESAPLRTPDTKDLTLLETSNDLSMSFEAQISDDEEAAIVFPSSGNQSMMSSVVETPKLESLSLFEGDAENSTFSGAEPDTRDVVEDSVGVPYSPLEEIPLTSPTPVTESIQTSSDLENRTLDELEEAYICTRFPEPKIFHKATYILDRLFAMAFSRAFISPFGTAHLYEPPLGGLNLTIIDRKLWHGKYKTFEGFVEDLREVAEAVKLNYDDKDEIYFISKEFINFFEDLAWELRSNSSETPEKQEVAPFSEQELKMIKGLECTEDSPFYIVKLATLAEVVRSNRGLLEKETFAAVHHPFFEDFGSTPDILTGTTENALPTVLRIFISHNRTALELARDEQNGFLLVFTNVTMSKVETKGHIRLQADCFVTKPIGKRHDIEDVEILQSLDSMKSWIKVAVLKAFKFDAEVPSRFRTYHLKPYRPVKYDPSTIGEHPLSQIIMEAKNHWDPNIVKERQLAMSGDSREFTPQPKMKAPVRKHPTRTRSVSTTKKKAKVKMNLTSTPKRTDEDSKMDVSTPESPTFKGSLQTRIRTDGDDASSDDRFLLPTFPKEIMKKEIESQLSSEAEDVNIDIVGMDVDTEFPDFASRSIANQAQIRSELTVRIEQVSDSISDDSPFQLIELTQNAVEPTSSEKEFARESNSDFSTRQLLSEAKVLYSRIKETGLKLGVHFENRESIEQHLSQRYVVGQFKNVHVSASDVNIVVQIYKGIGRELIESRLMELACLLKLRGLKRVGEILSIVESDDGIPTGLTMNRYQKTLKQYLHIRYNISPQQKYKLMRDLIAAVKVLHDLGIAHRNLSEENIMVNEIEGIFLKDGTLRPKVFLIDYGKARFTRREDIQRWYLYPLAPEEEKLLPRITSTPDHGYKRYRSIKTLPRSKNDIATLSHDINPFAEDIYSLGVLLWRIFTQQCPLACVFEDDILGLRQIVSDEHRLRTEICKAIPGSKCRELLFGCLAVNDVDRWSVDELSKWIWNQQNRKQLIYEIERDFNGKGV